MHIIVFHVYILTNKNNRVLYTGVTSNLVQRCFQHKHKIIKGFTDRYNVNKLIYYEQFDHATEAIRREKQIKGYSRSKKLDLINAFNNGWQDLCPQNIVLQPGT